MVTLHRSEVHLDLRFIWITGWHVAQLLIAHCLSVHFLSMLVSVVFLLENLAAEGARIVAHVVLPVQVSLDVLAVLAHVAAYAAHETASLYFVDSLKIP